MTTYEPHGTDGWRFRFEYQPGTIRFGAGEVNELGAELDRQGFDRALVVTGSTVGSTSAVMEPVRAGLGDRLAGTFAETTPDKRLETAIDGVATLEACEADVLVGVGGGSSLDVATVVNVLAAAGRDPQTVGDELATTGTISLPENPLVPVVAVPTTLAGADLSTAAGITASPDGGLVDEPVSGGIADPRLLPRAIVYDPELVATTPASVLTGSAMNGFDKGIESLYAPAATPITDATAIRGLGRLASSLPVLTGEQRTPRTLAPILEGLVLVQYGTSRPGATTLSIVHAFGHGLRDGFDLHQGVAHAVVVPHVLEYVFDHVHARRGLLAHALGVDDAHDPARAVVEAVTELRDELALPARLGELDGAEEARLPDVARSIHDDPLLAHSPDGLDPTTDEIESVLRDAY